MLQQLIQQHSVRFVDSQSPMFSYRQSMIAEANQLGLPSRKMESWHYTPLSNLIAIEPTATQSPLSLQKSEIEKYRLGDVFLFTIVDGCLYQDLSDVCNEPGLKISSLAEVLKTRAAQVQEWIDKMPKPSRADANVFRSLNSAYLEQGLVIEISSKTKVSKPIQILNISTGPKVLATFAKVFVNSGTFSECTLIESNIGSLAGMSSIFTYGDLMDGAHLQYIRSSDSQNNIIDESNFLVNHQAKLSSINLVLNPTLNRHSINVYLAQEGAEVNLSGLSVLDHKQVSDNQINVEHLVPRCTSRQLFKGVLSGQSKSVFSGRIHIPEGAVGTDSSQLNKNLILSRMAEADIKPQLEVFADDVKATHGAAIGRFDPEELFYLESRGIPKNESLQMLANAFVDDVLVTLPGGVKEFLRDKFLNAFSQLKAEDLYGS